MPNWKRYLRDRLDLPTMGGNKDERALAEMADHLEDLYRESLSRGVSEEEAEAYVLSWLGDPDLAAKDILRTERHPIPAEVDRWFQGREEDLRTKGTLGSFIADGLRDLRTGLKALARRPGFTGVIVLVLALGIGATSAIFTLVDTIILSPLPFADSDRLVAVQHAAPSRGLTDAGQSAAWHFTYQDESRAFDELGMYSGGTAAVTEAGKPEAVPTLSVTVGVFRAIRLVPVAGRNFTETDMDPDGPPTVMLGYGYWQTRFGGDPAVVGRTLDVDGTSREILGVTQHEVKGLGYDPALILPLRFQRSALYVGNIGYDAVGRLRDGVTMEQAAADLNRVLPQAWEKFPSGPLSDPSQYVAEVHRLKDDIVGGVAELLWILMGSVGLVLLIACANVANLFLVRADGKAGEMAVRMAIGASIRRIGWEYMKESLLLGAMGGVLGLVLAQAGLRNLLALAPSNLPRLDEVTLDTRVILFTMAISIGSGLVFGMLPVLRQRGGLAIALKEGGRFRSGDRNSNRAQNLLAVGQVAIALILLVASGLMLRSFQSLRSVDPGFSGAEEVLSLRLYIPEGGPITTAADVAMTFEQIVHSLEDLPGVESVGLATSIPMDGGDNVNRFVVRGQENDPNQAQVLRRHKWISQGYLETLRIPLLMGQSFTWDDIHNRANVAMLSESLAREIFGSSEAAMGQFIAARSAPPVWKEIVGIVADTRDDGMDRDPPALVYWPQVTLGFWEGSDPDAVHTWQGQGIVIRSPRVGTVDFLREVEGAVWAIHPKLPLLRARTLSDIAEASMARTSFVVVLLGIAGAVALVLGLVGIYGVVSYTVSQRNRELGMRMALGAQASQVSAMVVRQGVQLATVGVLVGIGIALGGAWVMSPVVYDTNPTDPMTFGVVALGLLLTTACASYLPARRAARVDPAEALRNG